MKKLFAFLLIISSTFSFSQIGGKSTFALLDLGFSARSNALGTDFITVKDQDVNLGVMNPSLYNTKMNNFLGVNQALMAGGISYGMIAYAKDYKTLGTFAGNLRYVNYGKMDRTDVGGTTIGSFTPSEYILGVGFGKQINPMMSVGSNVNLLYSQLENYNAFGMSIDMAGTYVIEKSNILITALVKNAGLQFNSYTSKNRAPLPTDFQLGIAHKLKHAPFRVSVVAHHLNKWNLTYVNPNLKPTIDALTGDTIPVKYAGFGEKLANHFTFQLEMLLGKNLQVRTAFDYHRRQDLKIAQRPGAAGFSFGVGLHFKRINVDYGFSIYSQAGFSNTLTLTSNISNWKK